MPGLGATDPADLIAQARREAGLSRQLQSSVVSNLIHQGGALKGIQSGTDWSS